MRSANAFNTPRGYRLVTLRGEAAPNIESMRPSASVDHKRMNTARIVILTIALGVGGVAACPAGVSGNAAGAGAPDVIMVENSTDDQALMRGESVEAARYGAPGSTATQK